MKQNILQADSEAIKHQQLCMVTFEKYIVELKENQSGLYNYFSKIFKTKFSLGHFNGNNNVRLCNYNLMMANKSILS